MPVEATWKPRFVWRALGSVGLSVLSSLASAFGLTAIYWSVVSRCGFMLFESIGLALIVSSVALPFAAKLAREWSDAVGRFVTNWFARAMWVVAFALALSIFGVPFFWSVALKFLDQ